MARLPREAPKSSVQAFVGGVAVLVELPAPTAVTSPDADTEATLALDETHVAWDVTFCVVPSDIAAVTVSWLV